MVHKPPPCRRTSHHARLPVAAARSSPVCLRQDRSHSSSPYIPAREPKLPARYFPVCAFSLFLLAFLEIRTRLGYSQNHLAVAGGCEAHALDCNWRATLAPTRYREVVLTVSKFGFPPFN